MEEKNDDICEMPKIKNFNMNRFIFYFCIVLLCLAIGFYLGAEYGINHTIIACLERYKDCICPVIMP